jgi:hypothetical protein
LAGGRLLDESMASASREFDADRWQRRTVTGKSTEPYT